VSETQYDLTKLNDLRIARAVLEAEANSLRDRVNEARSAYNEESIRLATLGYGAPVPIGTKCVRWALPGGRDQTRPLEKTTDTGTLEVVTRENRNTFAMNQSVTAGTFVLRIGDGKKFIKCRANWTGQGVVQLPNGWHPDGVTPEQKDIEL
jgi:hypothetical protein